MKNINEKASKYKYSSFENIDVMKMKDSSLYLEDRTSLIVLHNSNKGKKIYWATNDLDKLVLDIIGIKNSIKETSLSIGFVPVELSMKLEAIGFHIAFEYIDYWLNGLSGIEDQKLANIKAVEKTDYRAAYEILNKCSKYSRGFSPFPEIEKWDTADNSHILAYHENEKLLGLCLVKLYGFNSVKGTVVWIRMIAVDPRYHNRGIGGKLLNCALVWGRENGATRSFLAVDSENSAIHLYEKFGYTNLDNRGEINMIYNSQ